MAKQIIETLIDDIDGGPATETITFSLDGTNYSIDLSETNAAALREAMAPYVGAGTKIGRGGFGTWRPGITPSAARTPRPARDAKHRNHAIREWANTNGHELSGRGRIPQNIVDAYEAAQNAPAEQPAPTKAAKAEVTQPKRAARAPRKKVAAVKFEAH